MHPNTPAGPDTRNLILAIALATAIMVSWQYFYENPRQKALKEAQAVAAATAPKEITPPVSQPIAGSISTAATPALSPAPRITIATERLHGSISLRGARFDDLTLASYRETIDKDAPEVKLLAPGDSNQPYFMESGLLPSDKKLRTPDATTLWHADGERLTVDHPVTLRWDNGEGLVFVKKIAVDDGYMFTVTTTVINKSAEAVTLYPYALISRSSPDVHESSYFVRTFLIREDGPIAVNNKVLQDDITYGTLRSDGPRTLPNGSGWVGFGDMFWLTALIPPAGETFDATFTHVGGATSTHYQSDLRGQALVVEPGEKASRELRLFAGAKNVGLLDHYRKTYAIELFDRAVNFGSLYFLTKPIFQILSHFNTVLGNFGLAILLLTVIIKALLFPLASKSMTAMSHMKKLTPKMAALREQFAHDKMKLHQETAALYKREKVNPLAGCLPILIQIPIFLALYRVLSVTIEMRQAPFYGWIQDLSVADPTNLFTAFGLLPWATPSFLHIGVLPILMCLSMVIQQRYNPKPADEIQAMMMNIMPYIFLIVFATLPAGLVLYSIWNNVLTIAQQIYINKRLKKKGLL